jgi:restriction system protein
MPAISYSIDIRHEGLHAYRRITGRDQYVVEAKAAAQRAAWGEKWAKMQQREKALYTKEQKKDAAAQRTQKALDALAEIENLLLSAVEAKVTFEWGQLKDHSRFAQATPLQPAKLDHPTEPLKYESKYTVQLGLLDRLFSSRKAKKIAEAQILFDEDHAKWEASVKAAEAVNAKVAFEFEEATKKWKANKAAFLDAQQKRNEEIDAHCAAYQNKQPEEIVDYCDLVLSGSAYPDSFPKSWQIEYRPETRMLLVEYSLPNANAMPRLKEVKYIQSRDEFTESFLADSAFEKMYDGALYRIALRSIHELIKSDEANALDSIVFNGWVRAVEPATGQETNGCIMSLQVDKAEFACINLAKADPKACFKKLKGVGSSKLTALVPIRPILQLDTEDERFVPSYKVEDTIDSTMNLAAMDWEDFEHLIREVFEREFGNEGSEVKITRASRDGGVDAVVFDPDPLRGGKIVIQAKRYTNTVGVSAVRDLYGTVMNEGANKGILVTTADYGPDAYEFAKDKPLTLLSGNNLLHLLAKHGHQARIDLKEAKQILQNSAK